MEEGLGLDDPLSPVFREFREPVHAGHLPV